MARTKSYLHSAKQSIEDDLAWIDAASIPDAADAIMLLAGTVDTSRTAVVEAKARLIRRACNEEGYSVRKVAEMMGVSVGYVQRLKTQR